MLEFIRNWYAKVHNVSGKTKQELADVKDEYIKHRTVEKSQLEKRVVAMKKVNEAIKEFLDSDTNVETTLTKLDQVIRRL